MTSLQFLSYLIEMYGLYGVFVLVMLEGDLTLLLAGVLAHTGFFDDGLLKGYGFAKLVVWATVAGFASDNLAYGAGRVFSGKVREFRFYRHAQPRLERMTNRFGTLSIFFSKYIYGMRWAACTFYGLTGMPYLRFVPLSLASCFVWVFFLSGVGYFFSSAVMGLIGDFRHVGKILLGILIGGVLIVYLVKRRWVSKRVEEIKPERLHEIEHKAIESVKEFKDEIKEKIHLKRD
jgi:membrane protein DedA with SNARE-associated domain